jgi:Transmembrane domain of unknown function (DUF3566)
LSSREERPGRWDPEAPGASGGHLAPDVAATGPLFDPVTGAVREAPVHAPRPEPFLDDAPDPTPAEAPSRDVVPGSRRRPAPSRRRVPLRRVKRTIRHVVPFSVLKLSGVFYGVFMILWLVFVGIVYSILSAKGFFDGLENLGKGLALWDRVDITLWLVEKWAFFVGLAFAALGTLVNLFLSVLYNFAADTVGGLEVTFVERDL